MKSIPTIIIIMEEARDWSGVAMDAMDALEMLPPERVEGYVSQMKWTVEAFPPEKAEAYLSQAMELVKAFPPDKAEAYLSLVKKAVEALPPSRVDDYLAQAKTASERAVEAVETLEAYPPSNVSTLLIIGAAAGVSLMGGGFALIFRAGRSQPSSGGETRVHKIKVAPPEASGDHL